ncbi:hypothetical protein L1887_53400 [Cichorium endivia]|nr:hypothetical protein L1887_53400 [Cichorium endivia]
MMVSGRKDELAQEARRASASSRTRMQPPALNHPPIVLSSSIATLRVLTVGASAQSQPERRPARFCCKPAWHRAPLGSFSASVIQGRARQENRVRPNTVSPERLYALRSPQGQSEARPSRPPEPPDTGVCSRPLVLHLLLDPRGRNVRRRRSPCACRARGCHTQRHQWRPIPGTTWHHRSCTLIGGQGACKLHVGTALVSSRPAAPTSVCAAAKLAESTSIHDSEQHCCTALAVSAELKAPAFAHGNQA